MEEKESKENLEGEVDEMIIGAKPVPMELANKVMKSICKIAFKTNQNLLGFGTGFFMKVSDSANNLLTNYHVINPDLINKNIEIEIWNHKKMKLDLFNYSITYLKKPKDITVIKLKGSEEIFKDIEFLSYDKNYTEGYFIYQNSDIFTIQHPCGDIAAIASGTILKISDFEFEHNISTDNGSSGCPIILLNKNLNFIRVIGIHKNADKNKKVNRGTFIGEIFKDLDKIIINEKINNSIKNEKLINNEKIDKLNNSIKNEKLIDNEKVDKLYDNIKNEKLINNEKIDILYDNIIIDIINNDLEMQEINNNYIISEIYIDDKNLNKNIRIINSFEENIRIKNKDCINYDSSKYYPNGEFNEDYINEQEIINCIIFINDELIPFNYFHVFKRKGKNKIKYIFEQFLTRTNFMFSDCEFLTNIDLSNFNTQYVTNMESMFEGCRYLENINLSNFNTQNVTNMKSMFEGCCSLDNVNLSNFNTKNVTNMNEMFYGCSSLINLDLSTFNTQNVDNVEFMFSFCESLMFLNLSNFNIQNITSYFNKYSMFNGCKSLKRENVIVDDDNIIQQLNSKDECLIY